ncbi:hypothetical protein M3193_09270 [Sporosarcina luteola]|uniref:hypothetical protein n=1 Tax=Sporosarcina luteola TaxID=582850 RepID=UPI00203D30DB|nr:hypothetical protein [Sporosarcina luteola]MCM3744331.1 hypothetical protein [Sporosarcina luteola]
MDWNWNETHIKLPYTSENFRTLLDTVCRGENEFSQYDFAMWCDNLTMAFDDDEGEELNEYDSLVNGIARDIECQWDLYLINTYSLKELQTLGFSQVSLPQEWLLKWLKELNSL